MAKVQQKSEKITAFGGIIFVLDKFDRILFDQRGLSVATLSESGRAERFCSFLSL